MSLQVIVIGLNHKTAPVHVREKIAFAGDGEGKVTRHLADLASVDEAMILATCNRSEIVVASGDPSAAESTLVQAVGEINGLAPEHFREFLYLKRGAEAVKHVFRVTASLDSMVLGEPQILGQVKESYRRATAVKAAGTVLNRLMHRGFFTAKRVRNETGVGKAAISVAYVAVELAKKILGGLKGKRVLLIGAGEMAELAARQLAGQVDQPITCANRTFENACTLAADLCGTAVPMEKIEDGLTDSDVVITSTGSPDPIVTTHQMKRVMRLRRFRPVFIIDIAIPRDVEQEVNDIDGVYLYNIDDLQAAAEENQGERRKEALRAERIVEEEVRKFMAWTESLQAAPTIVALKEKLEGIRTGELARLNGKLSSLGPSEKDTVEQLTRSIINKIAHDPITFLKRAEARSRRNDYLDVAQRLFKLDSPTDNDKPREEDPLE